MNTILEFETTKDRVKHILTNYQTTRNSDKTLIIKFLETYGIRINNKAKKRLMKDLPSFETITRCRRKLQEQDKTLLPNMLVVEGRMKKENEVKQWTNI